MSQLYELAKGSCGSFGELYASVEKEQRNLWSSFQKDSCWTAMGSFDDDLAIFNIQFAKDALPDIGKACKDSKKEASARQRVDALIVELSKPRSDGLRIQNGLYGIVKVAKLVDLLEAKDHRAVRDFLSLSLPAEKYRKTRILLDDLSFIPRKNLVGCFNLVFDYRKKREECSGPWSDDYSGQISCYTDLVDGALGQRANALNKSTCGFDYHGLEKEIKEDVMSLKLYKGNEAQRLARIESFETLVARERQQHQRDEAAAKSVVDKMPGVARAYAAKALCSAFSNSAQIRKALQNMRRVDRKSGTSNPRLKRQYAQGQIMLNKQIARAKKEYRVAGGSKRSTSKVGSKFWCGQPGPAAVIEPLIQKEVARIAAARLPKPNKLCKTPLWQSLRKAAAAEGYITQFKTCQQKNRRGRLTPMPAPGAPLRENGRTLLYYRIQELNVAPIYLVFEQTPTGWVFFRRETCAAGAGGPCNYATDFSRSADRYERRQPPAEE